jgi:transposase
MLVNRYFPTELLQGHANAHIARELKVNVDTVRLWRDRWVRLQGRDLESVSVTERLQDAPRPGAKPTFSKEQRCQIAALACETPQQADRPISQWTGREVADELDEVSFRFWRVSRDRIVGQGSLLE